MLTDAIVVINQFGLVSICSLLAGALIRKAGQGRLPTALIGVIFGVGCCTAMLSPLQLEDGVFFDLRSLFIGLSTALFGIVAGLMTLTVAALFRADLGGPGAAIGIGMMVVTFGLAALWRLWLWRDRATQRPTILALGALGLMLSAYLVVALKLSSFTARALQHGFGYYIVAGNVIGSLCLGSLILGVLETIQREQQLARMAMTDPLTGLLNRRGLSVAYENWQSVADKDAGALIVSIDIDHFKSFNERHGHQLGDQALHAVAEQLRASLRSGDLAARVGGDEFVVILRDVAPGDSARVLARVTAAWGHIGVDMDKTVHLSVILSIGSHYATASAALQDALNISDLRMFEAKRNSRAIPDPGLRDIA